MEDLNALPEFRHYCQPLSGSMAEKEPGLVIEFPSEIVYGNNFFGRESVGGDSPLDPTWYATHIAAAGVHFEGYDDSSLTNFTELLAGSPGTQFWLFLEYGIPRSGGNLTRLDESSLCC